MALCAIEMVMLRVTVVMLVDAASIELKTLEESRIHEFLERSVHSRSRHVVGAPFARKLVHQLVGVKVFMMTEYPLDQKSTLFSIPLSAALQILLETLDRGHRNGDAT